MPKIKTASQFHGVDFNASWRKHADSTRDKNPASLRGMRFDQPLFIRIRRGTIPRAIGDADLLPFAHGYEYGDVYARPDRHADRHPYPHRHPAGKFLRVGVRPG
jgi:hypothetical protein